MEFVGSSVLVFAASLFVLWKGPVRGASIFFAVLPLGAAAALNLPLLGGASIMVADFVAAILICRMLASKGGVERMLSALSPGRPGFLLTALLAYSLLVTLFMPRLLAGEIEVFSFARRNGATTIDATPLAPSAGNVTQMLRLTLGALTFAVFVAAARRAVDARPFFVAMTAATIVHLALGFADVGSYAAGASHLMEFFRSANYAIVYDQVMAGVKRMVGGFPEASAFGYFSLGLFGFWYAYYAGGGRSRLAPYFLVATVIVIAWSTSTAAYVSVALFLFVAALLDASKNASMRVRPRTAGMLVSAAVLAPVAAAALFAAYELSQPFQAFADRILLDKLESDSALERMSWNWNAFQAFVESHFVGVGLGSVRASNVILASLASVGIIGTLLYAAFLASFAVRRNLLTGEERVFAQALRAGCLAIVLRAVVTKATPDLELLFFAMAGVAVGLMDRGPRATQSF